MAATTRSSVSLRERERGTAAHKGWEANLSAAGELRVRLFGDWILASGVRSSAELSRRLSETPRPTKISFDARELGAWDNILIEFLTKLEAIAGERGVEVDRSALPGGVERLVALARAVPERVGARQTPQALDLLTRVGAGSLSFFASTADLVTFLGEAIIGIGRLLDRESAAQALRSDVGDRGLRPRCFADRRSDQLPDRPDPRLCRRRSVSAIRRGDLCRRSGRHRDGA